MIKPLLFTLLASGIALSAQGNTRLYGYANGFAQARTSEAGTTLELRGYLTEFGFQNETRVTSDLDAGFDLNLGMNMLDDWSPYLRHGELSLDGRWGQVALFYGETPLGETHQWLTLMHQDPDNLPFAWDFSSANALRLPLGLTAVDGLRYRSPLVAERVSLDMALLPAEEVGIETGYSVTASWVSDHWRSRLGVELNGVYSNAQLMRLINEYRNDGLTLGLLLQAAQNTVTDASGQTVLLYSHWPWQMNEQRHRVKLTVSGTRLQDQNDETRVALYTSLVNQIALSDRLSLYGFSETKWASEAPALTQYLGAGATLSF